MASGSDVIRLRQQGDALYGQRCYAEAHACYDEARLQLHAALLGTQKRQRVAAALGRGAASLMGGFGFEDLVFVPAAHALNPIGLDDGETISLIEEVTAKALACLTRDGGLAAASDCDVVLGQFHLLYRLQEAKGCGAPGGLGTAGPPAEGAILRALTSSLPPDRLRAALREYVVRTGLGYPITQGLHTYLDMAGDSGTIAELFGAVGGFGSEQVGPEQFESEWGGPSQRGTFSSWRQAYQQRQGYQRHQTYRHQAHEGEHAFVDRSGKASDLEVRYLRVLALKRPYAMMELKRAYRKAQAQYHPDKVQHLGVEFQRLAEDKSKEINEAYEYLSART